MSHAVHGEFWQNVVHWRRKWQTTPVFLPREPHKQYEIHMCVCVCIYTHISNFIYSPIPLCEFAYSLKFICNPQVNRRSIFAAIWGHGQRGKKIWVTHRHVPSWGQIRWRCFILLTRILVHLTFLLFFFFWLVILLFKMAPKHSAEKSA